MLLLLSEAGSDLRQAVGSWISYTALFVVFAMGRIVMLTAGTVGRKSR